MSIVLKNTSILHFVSMIAVYGRMDFEFELSYMHFFREIIHHISWQKAGICACLFSSVTYN